MGHITVYNGLDATKHHEHDAEFCVRVPDAGDPPDEKVKPGERHTFEGPDILPDIACTVEARIKLGLRSDYRVNYDGVVAGNEVRLIYDGHRYVLECE